MRLNGKNARVLFAGLAVLSLCLVAAVNSRAQDRQLPGAPAGPAVTLKDLQSGRWCPAGGEAARFYFRFNPNGTVTIPDSAFGGESTLIIGTYTYQGNQLMMRNGLATCGGRLTWQERPNLIRMDDTFSQEFWRRVR